MKSLIVLCTLVMAAVAARFDNFGRPLEVQKINTVSDFNLGDSGVLTPQDLPTQGVFKASDNNFGVLGVLKPQTSPVNDDFSAIMLDLLPEFTGVLQKFGGSQGAQLSPSEMVSAFFPIVRKALEAKAKSEGRTLKKEEERVLSLTETSITLSTGVIEGLSVNGSASNIINNLMSIARPILEANAVSQDRTLTQEENQQISLLEGSVASTIQTMEDMTTDNSTAGIIASNLRLARYIMEARAKLESRTLSREEQRSLNQVEDAINTGVEIMNSFNGLGSNIAEMVPTFMRLSKFLYAQRASNESRVVSRVEEEELRFTETTLTNALGFIQDIVNGTASEDSLNNFMTTTRNMFQQRAYNNGRSSLDTDLENNLKFTEQALNLALSVMRGRTPNVVQNQPTPFVQPNILLVQSGPLQFTRLVQH